MDFRHQVPPTMNVPEPVLTSPPPLTPPGRPVTPPPTEFQSIAPGPIQSVSPAVVKPQRHGLKWLWWAIGGIILVGLLGGGYFAYSRGYISIPFLTPKEDQLFNRFADSLAEINNAQYTVQIGLKSEARAAGTTSVFPSADERKAESNDAKRKSDLASIRTALALYFDDNNSKYPDSIQTTLAPTYLNSLPTDPKDKSKYQYQSCAEGKHFILQTGLESGEYYYMTDTGTSGEVEKVPACGQNSNVSRGLLQFLRPTAYAQATSYSIESVGSQIGLGEPETNYPFLGLLNIFGLGDLQSVIDVFPSDIDTSAAITFYAEADKQLKDANALLAIAGSYRGDDLTVEFDLEGRKLGSTIYGIIRKFPGIPYLSKYVSPIKNTWVKIEPGDGNPLLRADTFKQASIKSGVESVRQSLKDALEGKIVTVDKSLGSESIAGVQSAHYRVALHPDKVKAVLEKIKVDRESKKLSVDTLEDAIKQLDKPGSLASLQRLADNSTVDIWVDKVKGYLRQISWSIVLVPPDGSNKLKDKQFRLTLTLTLDKVNQNVNVGRPGDAIDYAEAERKVSGITVEEQKFSRQRKQISAVRSALKQIHDTNGAYPESITNLDADLKQALDACKIKQDQSRNTNTYSYVYCNDYLLDDGPIALKDVYTDKPYGYSRTGEDYALTYEMKLEFSNTNSEFSSGSYYKDDYIEGKNTATSKDESIEKQTTSEVSEQKRQEAINTNANKNTNASQTNTNTSTVSTKDTDYDGLTDAEETQYGTSPTKDDTDGDGMSDGNEVEKVKSDPLKIDTDGDGYGDYEEAVNYYDPLGPGSVTPDTVAKWGYLTPPNTSPLSSNIVAKAQGSVALVTWLTNLPSTSQILYAETALPNDLTQYTETLTDVKLHASHSLTFPITLGKTYSFKVHSCSRSDFALCEYSVPQTITFPN